MKKSPTPLSRADVMMLNRLQRDARVTIETLADEAGLSPSTAQRRLQQFRDAGVIERDIVVLNPKATGMPITMLVELELDHDRPEHLSGLHAWIVRTDEIQSAWQITGRADYSLVIMSASIERFEEFMAELMSANRNVRKFTTSVALKTLKRTLAVPLSHATPAHDRPSS